MWKHNFDECNDTKARNRLTLSDRMQAIEAYEKTRNYTKVGLMFKCSAKQIRTIVNNKQKILAAYALNPSSKTEIFDKQSEKRRAKKVALLGRVMYEWFQRARRNPSVCLISYNLIQKVALEVRKVICVENFYPNNAWLLNFKEKYNIKDFDMKVQLNDTGPLDLDVKTIVEYVVEKEKQEGISSECNEDSSTSSTFQPMSTTSSATAAATRISGSECESENESQSQLRCRRTETDSDDEPLSKHPRLEPIDVIEIESDGEGDDINHASKSHHSDPAIKTLDQALEHLKPLEDFALMKEDYRVIGLISQLETILEKSKNKNL